MRFYVKLVGVFSVVLLVFAAIPFVASDRLSSLCVGAMGVAIYWTLQRIVDRLDGLERSLSLMSKAPPREGQPSPKAKAD